MCIVPRAQLAHVKINTGCIELCMSGDIVTIKTAALNLLTDKGLLAAGKKRHTNCLEGKKKLLSTFLL